MLAAQIPWFGFVVLGLGLLGLFVVLYWAFRLFRLIVSAPFRWLASAVRPSRRRDASTGMGSDYEQMVLSAPRAQSPTRAPTHTKRYVRRSRGEAAVLTVAFVVFSVAALGGLSALAGLVDGSSASETTAVVGLFALLAVVTLRAYPPGTKRPWVRLVLLTLFTLIGPLCYVTWLWLSGKKWLDPSFDQPQPTSP